MQTMLTHWLAADQRKKILLLRHGQIETATHEKRFIGQIDLPLSVVGKAQAAYWQSRLASLALGPVVASPLSAAWKPPGSLPVVSVRLKRFPGCVKSAWANGRGCASVR